MPTKKPRLSLTVDPQVYDTFTRLAKVQDRSVAAVIGDVLGAAEPPLRRVALFLEGIEEQRKLGVQANEEILGHFHKTLGETEEGVSTLLGDLGDILTQLDAFSDASQPPYGNTGVRSPPAGPEGTPKPNKKPGKTKG